MPQVKTKNLVKPNKRAAATVSAVKQTTSTDAHNLISKMLDYEAAARNRGLHQSPGRFEMLTASERQFYRAELIADYIRLSAGKMGDTQAYFDSTLDNFCTKICDMGVPSHELIGTYLAAVDIVSKEEPLNKIPALIDAVRSTMITVLQSCVESMGARA
ncbi:MAG: hypothetical protein ABFD54_14445 [Armatimonadota bacterium]|nr:hypothetical protein [bacterium]